MTVRTRGLLVEMNTEGEFIRMNPIMPFCQAERILSRILNGMPEDSNRYLELSMALKAVSMTVTVSKPH